MAPKSDPGTALATKEAALAVKEKAKETALAVKEKTKELAQASKSATSTLIPIGQFEKVLDFATKGGRAACWGLIGSSLTVGAGLFAHATLVMFPIIAMAGLMGGIGTYGVRVFSKIKNPKLAEVNEKLSDLKALYVAGKISEARYKRACNRVLKDAGY